MDARCFEIMVEDLRMLPREFAGRTSQPTAMILDCRTLQSTPESRAEPHCRASVATRQSRKTTAPIKPGQELKQR